MKGNFQKRSKSSDGFHPQCKFCNKEVYVEKKDRILNKQKFYNKESRDQIKEYELKNLDKIIARKRIYSNNRYKAGNNFCLICKTRSRNRQVLNGKSNSISTRDILGIDIDTYRKWVQIQFTPEMNWQKFEIDYMKPICLFDISKDGELEEAFSWKNTHPLIKETHKQKEIIKFLDYQLYFFKAVQFIE